MSDAQIARLSAKGFAEIHLEELAAELLEWNKKGRLPADPKMDQLAAICTRYIGNDEQYPEAQRLVIRSALVHAAQALESLPTTSNN